MLTALSIRDVVLIERLELSFSAGLTVLTGETGAGKSILLDSLGLALGARAEPGLVRRGAAQASVAARFAPPADHPLAALLEEHGIGWEDAIVLRRIVGADGRSRGFIDDQPVSIGLLRRVGALLVEVQGQHEQIGLADPTSHAALLDAFGVAPGLREALSAAWRDRREAEQALATARDRLTAAQREEEWLRHAVDELDALAPQPDEENRLSAERQRLQRAERRAEAIAQARAELAPEDRRAAPGPAAMLRAASRRLERLADPAKADQPEAEALALLAEAEDALAQAETLLARLAIEAEAEPRVLEATEERLFALRAAARKHGVAVMGLPDLQNELRTRLATLESGAGEIAVLEAAARTARNGFTDAAIKLSEARKTAALSLERAVGGELAPLRLDKARFAIALERLAEPQWGPGGAEAVRFLIATNPGEQLGALARVASGGELSRLMLALKVVLASASPVPTLVFDEVDSGIGGATAAAVGERLALLAERVQVLVLTHSPQVAARGEAHLRVSKTATRGRAATRVERLASGGRREEIARMLAGETVTEAARAAAADLLGATA